jgi:hypothetical protein
MAEASPATTANPPSDSPYLLVTRTPDGRYCVDFTDSRVSRRSYTRSAEQVVRQAQRAGGIPVRTDDGVLRECCQNAALPLI